MMRFLRKDLLQVQKSRRSGFRKATLLGVLAVSLTFAFSSRVSAQSSPGSSGPEASTFITKLTGTEVSGNVATTSQTAEEDKIFFLYNESEIYQGTQVQGKFLNLGGYWGTHVALSDVPYPFRLEDAGNGTYYIVSNKTVSNTSVEDNGIGSGNYVGWATNNKTTDKDPSISSYGVFASLSKTSGDNSQFAWHFEKVEGTDKYHIYLDLENVNVPTVTKDAITTGSPFGSTTATISWGDPVSGKFYLEATTSENVYGDYNDNKYPTDPDNYAELGGTPIVLKYPGAEAVQDTKLGDNSKWKLISLAEYNKLFNKSYKELTADGKSSLQSSDGKFESAEINVSYLLHDPDFHINDPELSQWKYRNTDGAAVDIKDYLSVGFDGYLKRATGNNSFSNTYTDEDGTSTKLTADQISNRARNMGVQVKKEGIKGEFYQTIQITMPGLYTLSSDYFSTLNKSKIFVRFNDNTNAESHNYSNKTYQNLYNETDWPSSKTFALCNAVASFSVESSPDYANFFISPELLTQNNGSIAVDCGIIVDHTDNGSVKSKPYISTFANENSDDTNNNDDAWTVIGNFQLSFRGKTTLNIKDAATADLILDEDEEKLDYVEGACDSFENLRLHRTFNANNWNTIILPVGLTKEQYTSAFGEDVPLAELSGLTPSEIQFTTVKEESTYKKEGEGVNDDTKYWLKPMTPYIIKAKKANGDCQDNYTGTYHYWDDYGDGTFTKSIDGSTKPYFLINNVNMVEGIIPKRAHSGDYAFLNNYGGLWNFAGLTATTNTKNSYGKEEKDECPYVVTTAQKISTKGDSIAAFGTFARNYTETTTDGKTTKSLNPGRPSLKDSYAMSGNKLTYYSSGTAMKGFRCWFEYNTKKSSTGGTSSAKPMPTLLLDGVNMATGIDEIMANDEGISMINQYQKGIFSLGGQRISKDASSFDALPKGIYIVNGKKVIKD